MKKPLLTLVGIMLALNLNAQTGVAPPAGNGSAGNPYEITTWQNLYWLSQNSGQWSKHFIQTTDIDFNDAATAISSWDSNQGWTPIGNNTTKFTGTYNGQGHTINGLFIDRSSTYYIGLFGYISGSNARVDSLGVTNADVTGSSYVGGLVGYNFSSTVENSYSTGSVSGSSFVGGLAGVNYSGTITNSYNTGAVSGSSNYVGGLVGYNYSATITNCYSTGAVSGSSYVGGLVGRNVSSTVSNSFWDTQTSGQSGSAGGMDKTTAEMQTQSTYTSAGWDFTNTWRIDAGLNSGYPYLSWQTFLTSYTGPSNDGNTDHLILEVTEGSGFNVTLFEFHNDSPGPPATVLPVGIDHVSAFRWIIEQSGGFTSVVLRVPVADLAGVTDPNSLTWLKRSTPGSGDWEDIGGTIVSGPSGDTLESDPFTSFSEFVIGGETGDNPLPVELSSFAGISIANGIELSWVTQSETDNAGFALLRNGVEIAGYETSESLKGYGTSSQKHAYAYTDADVGLDETYTYKLISVDYSGVRHSYGQTVEVSTVEVVTNHKPLEYALEQNYPNPFNPSTTITYTMKQPGMATLKVYDMLGRNVFEKQLEASVGVNHYTFNAQNLTSGVYFYQLTTAGFSKTMKMMLVK